MSSVLHGLKPITECMIRQIYAASDKSMPLMTCHNCGSAELASRPVAGLVLMQLWSAILSVHKACIRTTHRQALNQLPRLVLLQVERESGQDLMSVACCSASLAPAAVWLSAQTAAVEDRTPGWVDLQNECSLVSGTKRHGACVAWNFATHAAQPELKPEHPWASDKGTTGHARASQCHSTLAAVPS